jgi:hypothetical protein
MWLAMAHEQRADVAKHVRWVHNAFAAARTPWCGVAADGASGAAVFAPGEPLPAPPSSRLDRGRRS